MVFSNQTWILLKFSCIVEHVLYLSRKCFREREENQDLNTPSDFHIENARNNNVIVFHSAFFFTYVCKSFYIWKSGEKNLYIWISKKSVVCKEKLEILEKTVIPDRSKT